MSTLHARPQRSMLHLQMGQEVIYLVMAVAIMAALVLAIFTANMVEPCPGCAEPIACQVCAEPIVCPVCAEPIVCPVCPEPLDQPPIITLTEAKGFHFEFGSAQLTPEFEELLHDDIVLRLIDLSKEYTTDVIEVIGHTDEVPVRRLASNLDAQLIPYLSGQQTSPLIPIDNVGLGMARAAAVVRELASDPRLETFTLLPMSAGQTTTVGQELATGAETEPDELRRRIEIRLRRK